MPPILGNELAPQSPVLVELPCDTMEVAPAETTRVLPNTLVQFSRQGGGRCLIHVRGALIAEGKYLQPIAFARSYEKVEHALKPSETTWLGFQVEESGTLLLRQSEIYNATESIRSRSEEYLLRHVYFRGCQNLFFPDQARILDFTGDHVDELYSAKIKAHVEAEAIAFEKGFASRFKSTPKQPKSGWGIFWSLVGIAIVLEGVVLWVEFERS